MASRKRSLSNDSDVSALYKEWDEASCPICMDHPHNAVLLICSSYNKGCRSYICDTSYRHSNCLDRFKKLKEENAVDTSSLPTPVEVASSSIAVPRVPDGEGGTLDANSDLEEPESTLGMEKFEAGANLRCPLCRGTVLGWKVQEEARKYLNLKSRSCSRETCSFSGSYRELRRHARRVHPTVCPGDVDPTRQRDWRRLEDQREYNDIVSAIQSAMPGAVVFGDYVIENGDRFSVERDRGGEGGRWLSTFFLFHMFGSVDPAGELRGGRSRVLPRHRRGVGNPLGRRRYLWGENLLGIQNDVDNDEEGGDDDDDEGDVNASSDAGDDVSSNHPRRRRRLTRAQSDEDQH